MSGRHTPSTCKHFYSCLSSCPICYILFELADTLMLSWFQLCHSQRSLWGDLNICNQISMTHVTHIKCMDWYNLCLIPFADSCEAFQGWFHRRDRRGKYAAIRNVHFMYIVKGLTLHMTDIWIVFSKFECCCVDCSNYKENIPTSKQLQ